MKHGFVTAPKDWEYSSFHRAVRQGMYYMMWGAGEEIMVLLLRFRLFLRVLKPQI